ncbi:hypothetical protein J7382_17245 [Shimia sp. R11_0]|uniref:hypothetical protein n=1 Tax=Shimia sp. R11_0 TaxID=2821096 RepID=UPI001ADB6C47|nr:hypothetical protein [Shimia sp. R11_0]MBO9479294.1 hypothetical protein [Shimia sp. R11_0]
MSTDSAASLHPLAPHHLPSFISDASGADPMMTNVGIFVVVMVFLLTTFFLHLHSLPERLAHKVGANQLQIIGVLALIALFTHNNIYWVAALLLALIQVPDYQTPLERIADALDRFRPNAAPQPAAAAEASPSPVEVETTAVPTAPETPAEKPASNKDAEA